MRCGRTYAEDDTRAVLVRAMQCLVHHDSRECDTAVRFRVVDFGASWGRKLFCAQRIWGGESVVYIGIEAGSKVGACQKDAWVAKTRRCTERCGIDIKGLDIELTFADVLADNARRHPLFWFHAGQPTLGHVYDGGVFRKRTMREVADLATASMCAGSVMTVVTTLNDNDEFNLDMADRPYIVRIFTQRRWMLLKGHTLSVYESAACVEPTMSALFFRKRAAGAGAADGAGALKRLREPPPPASASSASSIGSAVSAPPPPCTSAR